jgi:enediyne biosynthesis protein E4
MRRVRWIGAGTVALMVAATVPNAAAQPWHEGGDITVVDRTTEQGLWDPLLGMYAHTAAAGDVNDDGWLDLYVGGFYQEMARNAFFRFGDRGATEISPDRLLLGGPDGFTVDPTFPEMRDGNSSGSAFADLDGDGDLDLLVSHYYPYEYVRNDPPPTNGQQVVVLRNDDGKFTRVGQVADEIGARTITVSDFDGDGNLDFFVIEDIYYQDQLGPSSSRLYLGNGDLTFREATADAGLPDDISGLGATAADLNGDNWPDLIISGTQREKTDPDGPGVYERARLFVNDGTGAFAEADNSEFTMHTGGWNDESAGMAVADLNRDGLLDVVIGAHPYPGLRSVWPQPIHIYLNEGADPEGMPVFRDVTEETGIGAVDTKSAHITLQDMDNDGWLDLVTGVSVGDGTTPAIFRHLGLKDGIPQFDTPDGMHDQRTTPPERSQWENANIPRYWPTGVTGDFDNDGDIDMFVAEWFPELPSRYFENTTESQGRYLDVHVAPEEKALGALVQVYVPGALSSGEAPLFTREVTANESYGGGATHNLHVGLGRYPVVDVQIAAPHTGETTLYRNVRAGQQLIANVAD